MKGVRVARKVIDEPSEEIVADAKRERAARRNPFARIALFIRQVIGELKRSSPRPARSCSRSPAWCWCSW
jgi:hypothetical protein